VPNVCGRGKYKLYFNLKTDCEFRIKSDINHKTILVFKNKKNKAIEIRIALSSVCKKDAQNENQLTSYKSFSQIKKEATGLWEEKLSKIQIKGAHKEQTIFYTSLYRTFLSPANVTSTSGKYFATDGKINETNGIPYYSSWSLWDTYRTKFPLLVLLDPKTMAYISNSLVRLYQSGKVNWSTDSEATPTVRTEHAVILLLDAYRKGIKDIDFKACYTQLCKEAAELPVSSPDQKLESTTDLWALAQIAEIIGKNEDAIKYRNLSEELFTKTWQKEFMKINSDFSKMGGNGLYQGTRWQYRWAVPQYLSEMKTWCSTDTLKSQLKYFFENHLFNTGSIYF
ncbi:MAG: glycoside hydrolase domain-containing protein, partial [Paludibacter sp.]